MTSTTTTCGGKVFKTRLAQNPHSFNDVYKLNADIDAMRVRHRQGCPRGGSDEDLELHFPHLASFFSFSSCPHSTRTMSSPRAPASPFLDRDRSLMPANVDLERRGRASSSNAPSHADIVALRVDALLVAIDAEPDVQRFVAIAGPPGGKSTFADDVRRRGNAASTGEDACVVVPMDGFHFPLAVLDARSDAEHARARRGAPFTFDADAFVRCVRELRARGCGDVPTFDHAIHDPVPGGCRVKRSHRVVLIEGNYLLLPDRPWVDLVEEKAYEGDLVR